MVEKLPPHDVDAEEAFLGSILIDNQAINRINLAPDDFYSERNRCIYAASLALKERGVFTDQITVANELARQDKLENCGGPAFLSHLVSVVPTSLDIEYYGEIVRRFSVYRKMIAVGDQIASIGYQTNPDIGQSLNKADELLLELRKQNAPSPIITPKQRASRLIDRYNELYHIEAGAAISSGLRVLDRWLGGGFYNGDVIIVGGRTSMGKTTFLQYLANHIGQSKNVLFCSGEMSSDSLSDRDVASLTGLTTNEIRLGKYTQDVFDRIIGDAIGQISESNVYHYDDSPLTIAKITQACLTMQLRHGLDSVFVDYLGMIDDDFGENQNIRLAYISRKLKSLARKFNVPFFVTHQLSRTLETRENREPELSDLRESGHIEEDADVVLFLYRDDYYYNTQEKWHEKYPGKEYPENIVKLIIAKQRQGPAGNYVKVFFDKKHQKYCDISRRSDETTGKGLF